LPIAAAGIAVALLADGAIGGAARQRAQPPASPTPVFRDVARQAGLNFIHVNGASDEKFLPEIIGAGGLFLDFDNDGWLDVFLVDGGSFADFFLCITSCRRARPEVRRTRCSWTCALSPRRDPGLCRIRLAWPMLPANLPRRYTLPRSASVG